MSSPTTGAREVAAAALDDRIGPAERAGGWPPGLGAYLVLAAAIFFTLTVLVWRMTAPAHLDEMVSRWIFRVLVGEDRNGVLGSRSVAEVLVALGSPAFVGVSVAILAGAALRAHDRVGAALAIIGPISAGFLTECVAKPVINAPTVGPGRVFPSGHAAGLAAVAVVLLLLSYRHWGGAVALLLVPAAAALLGAMTLGSLRLGRHWATDMVGGSAFGAMIVLGLAAIASCWEGRVVATDAPRGKWGRSVHRRD